MKPTAVKLPDGRFKGRYYDAQGRRRREILKGVTTQKDADRIVNELSLRAYRARKGLGVEEANPDRLTLKQATKWWLDHHLKGTRSEARMGPSVKKHVLNGDLAPLFLEQITPGQIAVFLRTVANQTSKSTANHVHAYLSGVFSVMIENGKFHGAHPIHRKVKRFKLPDAEANPWPAWCVPLIVANMPTPGWVVAAALASEAMLRRSEIEDLTDRAIDTAERVITIRRTKSGAARRVAITTRLAAVLLEHAGKGTIARAGWGKSAEVIRRAAERAGIPASIYEEHTFHDLRDTCASRLTECGAREGVVEFMGWGKRKSSVMRSRYLEYPNSRLREEMDRLTWPKVETEIVEIKKARA